MSNTGGQGKSFPSDAAENRYEEANASPLDGATAYQESPGARIEVGSGRELIPGTAAMKVGMKR